MEREQIKANSLVSDTETSIQSPVTWARLPPYKPLPKHIEQRLLTELQQQNISFPSPSYQIINKFLFPPKPTRPDPEGVGSENQGCTNDRGDMICTIVTQCSLDRLDRVRLQAQTWDGAMSVAVYIPYTSNNPLYTDALTTLTTFYDKLCNPNNINKTNELTISILYPSEGAGSENKGQGSENLRMEYPINSLRNLALQNVSEYSEYVCLWDVDVIPCKGLYPYIANHLITSPHSPHSPDNPEEKIAYIIPCFEVSVNKLETKGRCNTHIRKEAALQGITHWKANSPDSPQKTAGMELGEWFIYHDTSACQLIPYNLKALLTSIRLYDTHGFAMHFFSKGHGPTDFKKWLKTAHESNSPDNPDNPGITYNVDYQPKFEPYIVCKKRGLPLYDERFTGYGLNKIQHVYHLSQLKYQFKVVHKQFLISINHPPSSSWHDLYSPNSSNSPGSPSNPESKVNLSTISTGAKKILLRKLL